MYKLICMSFDGDYVTERDNFDTVQDAWDHSNDMGSRWFFYPFHFVVKNLTIKDSPDLLEGLTGKRVKTVQRIFNSLSQRDNMLNADCDDFVFELAFNQ